MFEEELEGGQDQGGGGVAAYWRKLEKRGGTFR